MRSGEASATAVAAARARAAHLVLSEGRPVHADEFALHLAGASEDVLRENWGSSLALRRLAAYFAMRHRFSEERLLAAVGRGIRQVVLLGAGLDTFALRHPDLVRTLRFVEVDHPDSQAFKHERMAACALSAQDVQYVPVDFDVQDLTSELLAAGVPPDEPTFFAWLGVTQYITKSASNGTFSFIASHPGNSEVVFDVVRDDAALPEDELEIQRFARASAEERGEPWISYFDPEALTTELRDLGFSRVDPLGPELMKRYFVGQPERVRPLDCWTLMAAVV